METVRERFTADAILIRKKSDLQNILESYRGQGGGAREARNNEEVRDPPLPFPDYAGHAGYVVKATFKCSTLLILPNLVVIADIVLKRKPFVNVFHHHCSSQDITSLERKDLK